jgi:dsDNA-binding SOS-regulon protein
MNQNTKDNKREIVEIPKEDLEKIYKKIEELKSALYMKSKDIYDAYDIILERKGLLRKVLNKKIIEDLDTIKESLGNANALLINLAKDLDMLETYILEKTKGKQTDKKDE